MSRFVGLILRWALDESGVHRLPNQCVGIHESGGLRVDAKRHLIQLVGLGWRGTGRTADVAHTRTLQDGGIGSLAH